jgi:hypothetical protein
MPKKLYECHYLTEPIPIMEIQKIIFHPIQVATANVLVSAGFNQAY